MIFKKENVGGEKSIIFYGFFIGAFLVVFSMFFYAAYIINDLHAVAGKVKLLIACDLDAFERMLHSQQDGSVCEQENLKELGVCELFIYLPRSINVSYVRSKVVDMARFFDIVGLLGRTKEGDKFLKIESSSKRDMKRVKGYIKRDLFLKTMKIRYNKI